MREKRKSALGARAKAQWLRALAAESGGPNLIPSIHILAHSHL